MTLAVALWLAATGGHFCLSAAWVDRAFGRLQRSADERIFAAVLVGVGTLSVVLHAVAVTVGIGLLHGVVGLSLWHGITWGVLVRTRPRPTRQPLPTRLTALELAAATVAVALVATWGGLASRSAAVTGTDAAAYHVPMAINLALGVSPFGLPPTMHTYPMAGSTVAAWFLVPTGDPLLVDLTMCLPFLLLGASVNWIFRLATRLSGLMWATWLTVALAWTPLMREGSLVSADLWFAAGFVAVMACVVAAWDRREWRVDDWVMVALAAGLLSGSKTTGSVALALIACVYVGCELARWVVVRSPPRLTRAGVGALAGAVLFTFAGGIWLIRNWYLFGSPVAPMGLTLFGVRIFPGDSAQDTLYHSVFGDTHTLVGYELGRRTSHFVRLWLGKWYLAGLTPMLALLADGLWTWWRGPRTRLLATRLVVALLVIGAGSVLTWLLIGAPWTSLEWTHGASLRYVLPLATLLPLLAFVGLFPTSWRWYDDPSAARLAATGMAVGAVGLLAIRVHSPFSDTTIFPALSLRAGAIAVAVVILGRLWPWPGAAGRRLGIGAVLTLVAAVSWAPHVARRDDVIRRQAWTAEEAERSALAAGIRPGSPMRELYLAMTINEAQQGRVCGDRRVFLLSRIDEPLTLQSPAYRTRVFSAARDVARLRPLGPLGPCDYIITTTDVAATDKGTLLVAALIDPPASREIATAGPRILIARR
jgi:hypothetical protein